MRIYSNSSNLERSGCERVSVDKRSFDCDSGVVGTDGGFEPDDDADDDDEVNALITSIFFSPLAFNSCR